MVTKLPPLTIVYATEWFHQRKFSQDLKFNDKECPIPKDYNVDIADNEGTWCTLTSSTDDMENAAAAMFHAPDTSPRSLPDHPKNQPWILESLETPYSSPFRSKEHQMANFDYLASYNLNSAFLFSYFSPVIMDVVNRPLPEDFMETKTKSAPILWIAKNCGATNARQSYIRKLMEYIDVHSYGDCLNNKPFPENKSRLELMSEYKFYLAVENSNCNDYVTEKLFDTLMMSAVPIVDGPSSYEGFIPSKRSVIYMDAYPDPKDLADYITYLHNNDTAYLEYLSYRKKALDIAARQRLDSAFLGNWSDPSIHNKRASYCSVCRGAVPWWSYRNDANQTEQYQDPRKDEYVLVDESCSGVGKWQYIDRGEPYQPSWTPRPRDEFTRPDFIEPMAQIEEESWTLSRNVLWANISFILFFILFSVFLARQSKKQTHTYTPV